MELKHTHAVLIGTGIILRTFSKSEMGKMQKYVKKTPGSKIIKLKKGYVSDEN